MNNIFIVLVDKNNKKIGVCEKMEVHEKGLLHRAFSVFVFNKKGKLLLQQRAQEKYHAPKKWSNTVCSHPLENEKILGAAKRRCVQEMGFSCPLTKIDAFVYWAEVGNGLIEHEHDTIFAGFFDGEIFPNSEEVMDFTWETLENIEMEMEKNPERFSAWFLKIFEHKELLQKLYAFAKTAKTV